VTPERARDINARLCNAYFIVEHIMEGIMPDLSDVSLNDAREASRIMAADPGEPNDRGGRTITCHVDDRALPRVLAAATAVAGCGRMES
jgi:hypothetical protein